MTAREPAAANTLWCVLAGLSGLFILGGLLGGLFLLVVPSFATLPGPATREELEEINHRAGLLESMLALGPLDAGCPSARSLAVAFNYPADWALDPYGVAYRIDCTRPEARVYSAGPDRRFDTDDDWPGPPVDW